MFHAWCNETGRSPRDPSVVFASGPHRIRGLSGVQIVRYGNWQERPDIRTLQKALVRLEEEERLTREEARV